MGTGGNKGCTVDISARLALSVSEASAMLGVSENHFRDRILPDLAVVRSGIRVLIPREALDDWLAARVETPRNRIDALVSEILGPGR